MGSFVVSLASAWICTYNGHVAKVALDSSSYLLRIEHETGSVDQGYATLYTPPGGEFREFSLQYGTGYAYYLRLWTGSESVDFAYCFGCAIYGCEAGG